MNHILTFCLVLVVIYGGIRFLVFWSDLDTAPDSVPVYLRPVYETFSGHIKKHDELLIRLGVFQIEHRDGVTPLIHRPVVTFTEDSTHHYLSFRMLPGSAAAWSSASSELTHLYGVAFELSLETPGYAVLSVQHSAPVDVFTSYDFKLPNILRYDDDGAALGLTRLDSLAEISIVNHSGVVVGGLPGSGKTASLLGALASMSMSCELHLFDGKSGFDLHPLRYAARTYDRSGEISAPLELLQRLIVLRDMRAEVVYGISGQGNYWNLPAESRESLAPVVVVLDECQTWLDQSGMDKDEKTTSSQITRCVRDLVQKARFAGIVVILLTQKPTADSIPTVVRDNCGVRIAFRCTTADQAEAILGKLGKDAPSPVDIPAAARGRCVTEVRGALSEVQSFYVSPQVIEDSVAAFRPIPDQIQLALDSLPADQREVYKSRLEKLGASL